MSVLHFVRLGRWVVHIVSVFVADVNNVSC